MANDTSERLSTELALLEAMYPEVLYNAKAREVRYKAESGSFTVRLPSEYLSDGGALPDVLSASVSSKDVRQPLKQRIDDLAPGEEVLDSIIVAFDELAQEYVDHAAGEKNASTSASHPAETKATIIVWLHHLLNTNKRKLCLSPPPGVSGVTKPGYPGVLLYSGQASAVHEHVHELKQQNWAAFQVRLEDDEEWTFTHGKGVIEVEAMKEIVAEVGEARKDLFMEAMRMK
ncbi:hypothetical protein LTR56_010998 [Elasticomyces elasticus]|nr:hypothetical protein LTR22_019584 [Elasticomyces elasticus]KAK3641897.1 hypothetical protein LTR56_010998 [Elasticomyces elasticus]KAK4917107.1 hypothetical protein LTR49_015010 [Elasticomyces elasticus]KAK5743766.1 hypothetical protein LTS12_023715 [Elasticomyces elasticus]